MSIYGDLQCFDINNKKIIWSQKYSIYPKNVERLIFDDKLILAIGNELMHIDLKSGKTLSKKYLNGSIDWIIKDDNKRFIVVGTEEDFIYCFDGENNRKLWSKKIDNGEFIAPVILSNSLVFQWHFNGSKYVQGAVEYKVYSLDINNRKKNWEYESKARLLPGIFSSQKGIIFSDVEGTITYIKAEDGNILWKCDTNENQRDIYFDMAVYNNTFAFI
ncbi:PQQ-binding-like beta-propeller repeat protein [Acetivibrio clariflavus]|uniref:outer membrane protein assembly factor BamB family protein n=1 Tax=Acetivibrio clariflavus TaxID=288965 RepID=UPI0031F5B0D2